MRLNNKHFGFSWESLVYCLVIFHVLLGISRSCDIISNYSLLQFCVTAWNCQVKYFSIKVKDINYWANKPPSFPYWSPCMPHSMPKVKINYHKYISKFYISAKHMTKLTLLFHQEWSCENNLVKIKMLIFPLI